MWPAVARKQRTKCSLAVDIFGKKVDRDCEDNDVFGDTLASDHVKGYHGTYRIFVRRGVEGFKVTNSAEATLRHGQI